MKLIPFVCQKVETSVVITYSFIVFLTEGGKDLWEIGSETDLSVIRQEYLEENGFHCLDVWIEGDLIYAQLDTRETNFSNFYNWMEIQNYPEKKREDCFRMFIIPLDRETGCEWFPSQILHTPFHQSQLTPYAVFQGLKNTHQILVE